jgi:hypothetical protein
MPGTWPVSMTINIRDQIIRPAKKKGKAASPAIESLSKPGKHIITQGLAPGPLIIQFYFIDAFNNNHRLRKRFTAVRLKR